VIDDFEPWRGFVCCALRSLSDLEIVGEATDGIEGVQKAQALNPDLVLLDTRLPCLNGIEAANRIRVLVPTARILFVASSSDSVSAEGPLCSEAHGHILKMDGKDQLLRAVHAVLRGETFVSSQWKPLRVCV